MIAVGTASMSQFRVLGGLIGIAVATSLSTPYIRTHLAETLSPQLALSVLESTETIFSLSQANREHVRVAFGEGLNLQIKLAIGFAAAQIPTTALMWTTQTVSPIE